MYSVTGRHLSIFSVQKLKHFLLRFWEIGSRRPLCTWLDYPIAPALIWSVNSRHSPSVRDVFPFPVNPKLSGNASVLCIICL